MLLDFYIIGLYLNFTHMKHYAVFFAISSNIAVVKDLGRSIGCPNARAHTALAVTPNERPTPNNTV